MVSNMTQTILKMLGIILGGAGMQKLLIAIFLFLGYSKAWAETTPAVVNLTVQQGGDYRQQLIFQQCLDNPLPYNLSLCKNRTPVNLTGYSFRAQARQTYPSTAVYANMSTSVVALSGIVTLYIHKATTATLGGKTGYWDLLATLPDGSLQYLANGQIYFKSTVTR